MPVDCLTDWRMDGWAAWLTAKQTVVLGSPRASRFTSDWSVQSPGTAATLWNGNVRRESGIPKISSCNWNLCFYKNLGLKNKVLCVSDLGPGKVWQQWELARAAQGWNVLGRGAAPIAHCFHPSIPPNVQAHLHLHTPSFTLICPWIELSWRITEQSWDAVSTQSVDRDSALRNQLSVCPCWPHLIQSKCSQRSSVSSPSSLPSHPPQLSSHMGSFQLCPIFSKMPESVIPFFSPGIGIKAGSKDISVWSEGGNICSKCFWNRHIKLYDTPFRIVDSIFLI